MSPTTSSIAFIVASSRRTPAALTLSATCSGRLAPMIAADTLSFCSTHATASWASDSPTSSAIGLSHQVSFNGTVDVRGTLDLDDAITTGAQRLADLGCEESLDVRRSMAAGDLARNQGSLEFPKRQVVMNVHTDGGPFAKLDNTRSFHSMDQVGVVARGRSRVIGDPRYVAMTRATERLVILTSS
jgi:hypothetical protein